MAIKPQALGRCRRGRQLDDAKHHSSLRNKKMRSGLGDQPNPRMKPLTKVLVLCLMVLGASLDSAVVDASTYSAAQSSIHFQSSQETSDEDDVDPSLAQQGARIRHQVQHQRGGQQNFIQTSLATPRTTAFTPPKSGVRTQDLRKTPSTPVSPYSLTDEKLISSRIMALPSTGVDEEHMIAHENMQTASKPSDGNKMETNEADEQAPSDIKSSNKFTLLAFFSGNLALVLAAAKLGLLNGPLLSDGSFGAYSTSLIERDAAATVLSVVLAVVFVKAVGLLNDLADVSPTVTRKIVHTLTAPLFILVWPLFSDADGARFFAGAVSLTNLARLYLAGKNPNSSLAKSVSRSGDISEALGGPFVYVCILHLIIWTFWRSSPVGVVALATMAAGDGMADLVGRKWGKNNQWDKTFGWDFAKGKSVAGTAAFAVSASAASVGLLAWLSMWGGLTMLEDLSWVDVGLRSTLIATICAFIELLPVGDDNYTVPISAGLLAALLLT